MRTAEKGAAPYRDPLTADAHRAAAFHVVGHINGYRIRAYKGFVSIRKNVRIGNADGVDIDQFGIGPETDPQVDMLTCRADYDSEREGFSVVGSIWHWPGGDI